MFSQLFYLIAALLIAGFTPEDTLSTPQISIKAAVIFSLGFYLLVLVLIALQNILFMKRLRRARSALLGSACLLLLLFLIAFHFLFMPIRALPASLLLASLLTLTLYFGGLYVFHYTAYSRIPAGSRGLMGSAHAYACNQLQFLLPFCLPFLLMAGLADLLGEALFLTAVPAVLLFILLFYPPLTIRIWRCRDLSPSPLKQQLDRLCEKARFRHAGMKTWTVLNHSYTAAIVGILPRFRYIMFTRRLLDELPPPAIAAILAHEIGHNARRHLLYYPLILSGIFVLFILGAPLLGESPPPLVVYAAYTLCFLAYLRFVFGYFSRLFEREADLHVYRMGIPVEDMQLALDEIGRVTGGTHQIPCWHHHSIQKRIQFLEATKTHPELIDRHHRLVRTSLILYIFLLALGIFFTYLRFF